MWFRLDDDVVNDHKVQRLPDALFKAWINMLCVACKNDGRLPPLEDIAFALRVDGAKATEILVKLVQAQLVDRDEAGHFPHEWEKWQYKVKEVLPDGEADHKGKYVYFITALTGGPVKIGHSKNPWARVGELQTSHPEKLVLIATFRSKSTEADLHLLLHAHRRQGEWFDLPVAVMDVVKAAYDAKSDYASLLLLLRSELRSECVRSSDVAAPRTDTEQSRAETDQKQKEGTRAVALVLPPDWPSDWFDRFWQKYPNKVDKAGAQKSLTKAAKAGISFQTINDGLDRYIAKTDDRPWCNPTTWINQARWDEQRAEVTQHGKSKTTGSLLDAIDREIERTRQEADRIARDEGAVLCLPSGPVH